MFQQVIHFFKQQDSLEEESQLLQILNVARDKISDEDYEAFIWESPDFALQLVKNYMAFGGDSVTESFDLAVIPFVMKVKQSCDTDCL